MPTGGPLRRAVCLEEAVPREAREALRDAGPEQQRGLSAPGWRFDLAGQEAVALDVRERAGECSPMGMVLADRRQPTGPIEA